MKNQPKILVIDDDKEIRDLFKWMLEASGYNVEFGTDGVHGLKKFNEMNPDLVFLDIKMPRMDGFETLKQMKKIDPKGKCPVLVITGFVDNSRLVDMLNCGARDYICKPFNINELTGKIEAILGSARVA